MATNPNNGFPAFKPMTATGVASVAAPSMSSQMSGWLSPSGEFNSANIVNPNYGSQMLSYGANPALTKPSLFPGTEIETPGIGFSEKNLDRSYGVPGDVKMPDKEGGWMEGAGLAISALQAGTGIYSAIQQAKMNDFMKSYYKDQMNLMRTDFANSARSANEALAGKQERILSAQGVATGSEEMEQGVAAHMAKWGAKETV